MPITTFLNEAEKLAFNATSDDEINELFKELKTINKNYYIQEIIWVKKRFFRKPVVDKTYTLYYDYAPESHWDIQIINFFVEGTSVSKKVICNYLLGLLTDVGDVSNMKELKEKIIKDGGRPAMKQHVAICPKCGYEDTLGID